MKVTSTRRRVVIGVLGLGVLIAVAVMATRPNADEASRGSISSGRGSQWRVSHGGGVRVRIPMLLTDQSLALDFGDLPPGELPPGER